MCSTLKPDQPRCVPIFVQTSGPATPRKSRSTVGRHSGSFTTISALASPGRPAGFEERRSDQAVEEWSCGEFGMVPYSYRNRGGEWRHVAPITSWRDLAAGSSGSSVLSANARAFQSGKLQTARTATGIPRSTGICGSSARVIIRIITGQNWNIINLQFANPSDVFSSD